MQQCPSQTTLASFLAQELSFDGIQAFEEHLSNCTECQSSLHKLTDDPAERNWRQAQDWSDELASKSDTWLDQDLYDRIELALTGSERRTVSDAAERTRSLPELPGYEILRELAHGGMAVVYLAWQLRPRRHVAIKFIASGPAQHQRQTERLIAEADALGRLNHPNIVEIFEVGEHQNQPYLVLEYLGGGSLEDRVKGAPLPVARVAALMETVATAMEAAHSGGLVHRDLKPSNILLTSDGTPKIADFGLVKQLRSEEGLTTTGAVLGTPSYMAPEQAAGQLEKISAGTDIYGIGAILYALLAGRPPFQGSSPMETVLQVLHEEPTSLALLRRGIPIDLQTICMRCLEKEPRRRYASAGELADDLRRFQAGEPILARPVGVVGQGIKWARRRPTVATLAAAVILVTLAGLLSTTWLWDRAEWRASQERIAKEEARESEAREKASRLDVERLSASLTLDQAQSLCDQGDLGPGLVAYVRALELAANAQDASLEQTARRELAAWEPHFIRQKILCKHPSWVLDAKFSPDEKTLLTVCYDHKVRLWDVNSGKLLGQPLEHPHTVFAAVFDKPGRQVFSVGGPERTGPGEVRCWDVATGKLLREIPCPGRVTSISYRSADGALLTVCPQQAQVWKPDLTALGPPLRHRDAEVSVASFGPDGRTVATGGTDGTVRFWDAADGHAIGKPVEHGKKIVALAFHPNGQLLASASERDATVLLWDTRTQRPVGAPLLHGGPVKVMVFSADGHKLATGGPIFGLEPSSQKPTPTGGEARIWQATSGVPMSSPLYHPMPVWSLDFDPSGDRLLTGCEDGFARLYATINGQQVGNSLPAAGTVMHVGFSKDGQTAVTAAGGSSARLWDLRPTRAMGRPVLTDPGVRCVAFHPHGKLLALGCADGTARLWDLSQERTCELVFRHGEAVRGLAWSAAGDRLMTGGEDKRWCLWHYPSGKLLREHTCSEIVLRVAALPDARGFLTGQRGEVQHWDERGNRAGPAISTNRSAVMGLRAGPDGETAWVSTYVPEVRCFDLKTGQVVKSVPQARPTKVIAVDRTGSTLLTGSLYEGFAQLWSLPELTPRGIPIRMKGPSISAADFSPSGQEVFVCNEDSGRLWDVATSKPIGPRLQEPRCQTGAFSPDGKAVVIGGKYGARLWPVPEPMLGTIPVIRERIERLINVNN